MPDDDITVTGLTISADWVEALQSREADAAAGDADWHGGATYVHDLDEPYDDGYTVVPAGLYVRTVEGGRPGGYVVTSGDPYELVESIEAQYVEECDAD